MDFNPQFPFSFPNCSYFYEQETHDPYLETCLGTALACQEIVSNCTFGSKFYDRLPRNDCCYLLPVLFKQC